MNDLDKKDIDILRELDFDAKLSISQIARRVKVSKEVANYRLKKLIERKVILGFIPIIDPYVFGYQLYGMHLRFKEVNQATRTEVRNWADSNENAMRILHLGGKWHFFVSFFARSPLEFNRIYESLIDRFGSKIQRKTISVTVEMEHWPYNFLYPRPITRKMVVGEENHLSIDKTDYDILKYLSKDCRIPLVELAQKVKLTANAVKYRIANLEKTRIIKGYRTLINHSFFKLSRYSITLHLSDLSPRKEVMNLLGARKEVIYIVKMMGTGDVRFEMLCDSPMRVYSLIDEINAHKPGLISDFEERTILAEEIFDYFPNN